MNGQPTAQNTRECGANGEFVAFRNWNNPDARRRDGADLERRAGEAPDLDAADPRDADLPLAETGSIRFLWIIATNPAVCLPELAPHPQDPRARRSCSSSSSDAFLTETAAARRRRAAGRDLGREDRLHRPMPTGPSISSDKAIEPPGEARSDLDILLDYARRMDFRDKDGAPLVKWSDAEGAFEAWKACTQRPAVRLLAA